MNERRIARIERQIKERIAMALVHDISDPRMGFVTISRVEMDKEMQRCKVFWSAIGDAKARKLSDDALRQAAGFLRREVAQVLHTRSVPELEFRFDESVEGSERMRSLLDGLREERGESGGEGDGDGGDESEAPGSSDSTSD